MQPQTTRSLQSYVSYSFVGFISAAASFACLALFLSFHIFADWGQLALPVFLLIGILCARDAARSNDARPAGAFLIVLWALPVVMVVTYAVYVLGVRVPRLIQGMAIGWPQLLFFGLSLFWDGPGAYVLLSERWAGALTIVFWALVAIPFSWGTRRVKRFPVLLGLALTTVLAIVFAIYEIAPLLNWKFEFDSP